MDLDGRRGIGTGKKDSEKREAGNEPRDYRRALKGAYSGGDPPLTIPNRAVKPARADGTAFRRESRSVPNSGGVVSATKRLPFFYFPSSTPRLPP